VQSLKAAAIVLAAASLCAAQAPPPGELRFEFEGNRVFTSEQLRQVVTQCYEAGSSEAFDAAALDYCLGKDVVNVMRRAGYVRAQFGAARTARLGDVLTVTVPVEENEFYRFGRVTIEGAAHFDAKSLRELLPLKRGDIADAVAVTRWAFTSLQRKYADEGFIRFAADVEPVYRVEPGAPEGVLDLTVTLDEGKRFTLRSVNFEGDAGAPVDVLREALGLREGEVFRQREYVDALGELNRHILFDREHGRYEGGYEEQDVEVHVDAEAGALDITIRLTEKGHERAARPGAEEDEGRPARPTLQRRPEEREE
jgi:outer membrane protein assembly factor BamA